MELPKITQDEIWKPVNGYEGRYEISSLGRLKSFPKSNRSNPLILKPAKSGYGYLSLCLFRCDDGKKQGSRRYIHKMVAEAFIPNPKNLKEVNHINADKLDNRVVNLEWVSPKENVRHSHLSGNSQYNHIISDFQVQLIRYNPEGKTNRELADEFGISIRYVRDIRDGIRRKIDVYKELRQIEAKAQKLVEALNKIKDLCEHEYYGNKAENCPACIASIAIQQWNAGKVVEKEKEPLIPIAVYKQQGCNVSNSRPCPHCGKELNRDRNLCCECGKKVEG